MKKIEDSSYRILVLGESTTASISNQNQAWPEILSNKAVEKKLNLTLYNEAVPATNSSRILDKLPHLIEKYKPHLIITMMGINDTKELWPKNLILEDERFSTKIKSLKLAQIIYSKIRSALMHNARRKSAHLPIYASTLKIDRVDATIKLKKSKRTSKEYEQALIEIQNLIRSHSLTEQAQFWARIALDIEASESHHNQEKLFDLFFITAQLNSNVINSAELALIYALKTNNRSKCKDIVEFALRDKSEMRPDFLNYVVICIGPQDPDYVHKVLKIAGDEYIFRPQSTASPAAANYIKLKNIALNRRTCLLALGYPNAEIYEFLKYNYADQENGIFISEQNENFKEALKTQKFTELFVDDFGGSFGHATYKGNELIATHVLDFLIYLKNKKTCAAEIM